MTAYGALIFDAQVKADDFVIIPAASSSVGLAAIQLTNFAGATPIALTAGRLGRETVLGIATTTFGVADSVGERIQRVANEAEYVLNASLFEHVDQGTGHRV